MLETKKMSEFLRESFQEAKDADAKGALVLGQAVIFDLTDLSHPLFFVDGPADFWDTLKTETLAFGNPVVALPIFSFTPVDLRPSSSQRATVLMILHGTGA